MRSSKKTSFALGLLLAIAGLVASFAVVATAPAQTADETTSSSTTVTTPTTTTPTTTAPMDIANDVTVGGVPVGGMSVDLARTTIESAFNKRLVLRIGSKRVAMAPSEVAARASVDSALRTAQSAAPGSAPIIEAQADAWLIRANAYTQSATADLMRVRAIDLADAGADVKSGATNTSNLGQQLINLLQRH